MRRAATRLLVLVVVPVFVVVSLVAPATVLAKPKPAKYVLVSETKGCLVTLNAATGRLTFTAEQGHYGTFTVVVRHGKTTRTYHFTVRHPKPGQKLPATPVVVPVSAPTATPIVINPISIHGRSGPGGPGAVSRPTRPTTTDPPPPPKPAASLPGNVAPVLHVNGGVISWSADKGATTFHGAISTAPKNAAGRKTTYTVLGIVTSWKPATPACGTTLYYGVASEGNAAEQWAANEVSITGPKCVLQNVAPVLHVNGGVISWSADQGATTFRGAISTAPRNAAGRTTTYTNLGLGTTWTPATPPCGTTLYYGVASEGQAGEQWTANEVTITGPTCPPPPTENVAPTLTSTFFPAGNREPVLVWPQDPGATSYKAAICTAARGAPGRSCTYMDNIGSSEPQFGANTMSWDLLAAPCGSHWISIASEGPAGELWSAQEYSFGPGRFDLGLPACPPPEVNGPPVGEQVFSTNPEDQCAAAINLINQDDGSSLSPGGFGALNVLSPTGECQTMGDLAAPSIDGVLGPVSAVNQDHLCEDWATVINEYTDFISGWYVGSTGDCDVVTPAGLYIEAFNGSMASGNGLDAVPDYARAELQNYNYPLPWTTAVPN
jgi:hypothetical protein